MWNAQNFGSDDELFDYLETTVRPALDRHLAFKSRFRMSPDDIHDLVQESLIRLFQKKASGSLPSPLEPWLYKVADNLLIDHFRKKANQPHEELPERSEPSGEDAFIILQMFHEAYADLTDNEHAVFFGIVEMGRKQSELAKDLNVPQTTIAHWYRMARKKLRENPKLATLEQEVAR